MHLRTHSAAADALAPLFDPVFAGRPPVRIELWDGSAVAAAPASPATGVVRVRSARAVRRLLWAPGELGLGRAYVAGDIDLDGDVPSLLDALKHTLARVRPRLALEAPAALRAVASVGALGPPPRPPSIEAHLHGRRHSRRRDQRAISHHYDVGNEFYALVLGPTLTYSCARWGGDATTLEAAQTAKHDLVCRKLGLHTRPGQRLLDVGCGWGSMAMHAAAQYGAHVVGVTISEEQCELARRRVKELELEDLVDIRLQDYRDVEWGSFDAISSIGMFEHVGTEQMAEYFDVLRAALRPTGRLLNHAISKIGGSRLSRRSFIGRYVFPDGDLLDIGDVVTAMERAGFEVRDVESLREHYARTLRAWIANLEGRWDDAVREVGEERARVWRLYMAGSAVGFDDGGLGIHQVLGVLPDAHGRSGMPARRDW
jgi:cyclopropane-fatty-acyl-phospholipid synthase